jgi:LacI family transcriptional regulator
MRESAGDIFKTERRGLMALNRQVTIYDIAEAADVSASTVSRALRKEPTIARETRKRILAKAEELGYRFNPFAASLRMSRTRNIGVIVPKLDSYFVAGAVAGIEKTVSSAGYNVFLVQSSKCEHKERAAIDNMYRARVDGLILFGLENNDENNIGKIFSKKQTPVIVVDSPAGEHFQSVSIDNHRAAYDMTTHLYDVGCRCIAHVTPDLQAPPFSERFRGYQDALHDKSLPGNREFVVVDEKCEKSSDFIDAILALDPFPDAILFGSDASALLAIPVLRSKGLRIPEDICLAGFGNDPVGRIIEPRLTTIDFSPAEMGQSAATLLLQIIENPQLSFSKQTIKHELIIRESSSGVNSTHQFVTSLRSRVSVG